MPGAFRPHNRTADFTWAEGTGTRGAGRRGGESSEAQRRRAEALVDSRKIRFSSSKLYPGKTMAVRLVGVRTVEGKIWLTTNSRFFAGRQIPLWPKLFVSM